MKSIEIGIDDINFNWNDGTITLKEKGKKNNNVIETN